MNPKDRLLDAAERIVLRDGVARLTLDAVAAETQVSKGGLLYHFHSKDDLIRGMVQRLHDQYWAEVQSLEASDPNPRGRRLRAMMKANFSEKGEGTRSGRVAAGLLAAVALNPSLLVDLQQESAKVEERLMDDGIDPVLALIIHKAMDGIWMSDLFGFGHPSGERRRQIISRLLEMTQAGS